ncbi:hypothetical protein QWZ08_26040 [Ferruginibacter paludis]|uniref:hypothetical protein n=1 Tax=Ferruginibacter paludis TaxID=1310417 RepID=UPI0025B4172A|nr:hypothetical protein [Ferruginibacter paludis]MDN3659132.1 hypothetical protein [Ferruginibacter paludis]
MFKQLTAIILIAAFVAQTFSGGFVMLDYYTNKATFAKNCINKTRPVLHCNGKCQMMKKLKQEESRDKQSPERKNAGKNEVLYLTTDQYTTQLSGNLFTNTYHTYNSKSASGIPLGFFQPPRV